MLAPRREHTVAVGLLALAASVQAQAVPRAQYYSHLPAMPKLIRQTEASARLQLCGDWYSESFRDIAPLNGIDDARDTVLLALAQRFTPILRRNNFSGPVDIMAPFGGSAWVKVDRWTGGQLADSDSVALGGPAGAVQPLAAEDDRKLAELLESFSPDAEVGRLESAETNSDSVLFIDYPGEDERSWRRAYRSEREFRAYVHPFVHEDPSAGDDCYALVLQY